jgi:hypothetical protein
MTRIRSSLQTGLIAAAALAGAAAPAAALDDQRRPRADDSAFQRGPGRESGREQQQEVRRPISESEALSRAQRQARGARFVGSQGRQGSSYVFLFEKDGRTFTVSVSAYD